MKLNKPKYVYPPRLFRWKWTWRMQAWLYKKRFFVSQKNLTIKLNYYLGTISGNTDLYTAKDKNKVSFLLRYNKRSGHKIAYTRQSTSFISSPYGLVHT